jgi:transcriptional regulator with XRE-family HTH domain
MQAEQCRGARAMLELSREALARMSSVNERTISDFESGRRKPIPATLAAIRAALESAGVEFIDENGGGPGVRLKKKGRKK